MVIQYPVPSSTSPPSESATQRPAIKISGQHDLERVVGEWFAKNRTEILSGWNVQNSQELHAFERRLILFLMQLGALIMALVLRARIEDRGFQQASSRQIIPARNGKFRFVSYNHTKITTLFGNTITVLTRYFAKVHFLGRKAGRGKRGKNGSGVYPALEMLGIRYGVTPALASEISREVSEGPSMESAQERLSRRGINFNIKVVKRVSESFAKVGLHIRNTWLETGGSEKTPLILDDESLEGMRVLISIDGGRIRTRVNKKGRKKKGSSRHGYDTPWREPKMLTIRAIDEKGKVRREIPPIYDGTIDDADAIFHLLEAHLSARNIALAKEVVCAADGAPWIWERMENLLIRLGVEASKVSYVVDFYHAVEHLAQIADEKKGWSNRTRRSWFKQMRSLLKRGGIDEVIVELKTLVIGRNAKTILGEVGYFEKHRERMRYDVVAQKNLPLGSGAMESAIRQVVNMRLKSVGMFWEVGNAEGFLHLRCYLKAGKWNIIEQAIVGYQSGVR